MDFDNSTQLHAAPFHLTDDAGADSLLVIVKGTWSIGKDWKLSLAEEQVPIHLSPVYHGDPGSSSLRYDTDFVLQKPGTDCALIGHAWAPNVGAPHVDVTFALGPLTHRARVFGERRWIKRIFGAASLSKGAPFESMPLTWERSFGGTDASSSNSECPEVCSGNPLGRGFLAGKAKVDLDCLLLPNIENPADLMQNPGQQLTPHGFGMIPPGWQPRAGYAGTHDDTWRCKQSSLPPTDIDQRFYSSSAPGLCTPAHLTGREQVFVEGADKKGALRFQLPGAMPRVSVRFRYREEAVGLRLDTVIVEPDESRVILVWRGEISIHGKQGEICRVRIRG